MLYSFLFKNLFISDPPFAPQNLRLIDYSSNFLTIAWDAPEHDGGSPILGYIVEKRDAMRNMWIPAGKTDIDTRCNMILYN